MVRLPGSFETEHEARRARDRLLTKLRSEFPATLTRFIRQWGRLWKAFAEVDGGLVEIGKFRSRRDAEDAVKGWQKGERRLFW